MRNMTTTLKSTKKRGGKTSIEEVWITEITNGPEGPFASRRNRKIL